MQIASNEIIEVISLNDISESMKREVWKFESSKEDLINKPEEIKNKIISGRVEKTLKTKVLLETCFEYGAVARRDKSYYTLDDEPICDGGIPTLQNAAEFLASNLGQDMRLGLEAKLKLSRK